MWVCVNGCTHPDFVLGEDGFARCRLCGGLVVYRTPTRKSVVKPNNEEKENEQDDK